MSFAPYEKMPKSLKKLGLSQEEYAILEKLDWVVTEKIHGANFSFIYENQQLKFAKRKAYLSWNDDFFGFQAVVQALEHTVIGLFETLSKDIEGQQYIIYGELFGGTYPHDKVKPDETVQAIQTGIYYAPSVQFYAFDIAIVNKVVDEETTEETIEKYYLDYSTALTYFERYNLFHAKSLQIGTLNEALEFDIQINSTIPKLLEFPKIEDNIIEGVIIKPLEHLDYPLTKRPIIKLKNPEFEENDKFHQAQKWSYIPAITVHTQELDFIIEALRTYITPNRRQSAISKIGGWNPNNPERMAAIQTEYLTDIWTDFNLDHGGILEELEKVQQDWIKERIKAMI